MSIRAMEAHKVLDITALTLLLFAFAALANAPLPAVERACIRGEGVPDLASATAFD